MSVSKIAQYALVTQIHKNKPKQLEDKKRQNVNQVLSQQPL